MKRRLWNNYTAYLAKLEREEFESGSCPRISTFHTDLANLLVAYKISTSLRVVSLTGYTTIIINLRFEPLVLAHKVCNTYVFTAFKMSDTFTVHTKYMYHMSTRNANA